MHHLTNMASRRTFFCFLSVINVLSEVNRHLFTTPQENSHSVWPWGLFISKPHFPKEGQHLQAVSYSRTIICKIYFPNLLRKDAGYLLWVKETTLLLALSNWKVFTVNLHSVAGCEAQCIMVKLSAHWKSFQAIARSYRVLINLVLKINGQNLAPFQKEMFPLGNTYW